MIRSLRPPVIAALASAALLASCSRGGTDERGADPPPPAAAPAPVAPGGAAAPGAAAAPAGDVCEQRRRCCVALGSRGGLEAAKPLCQMHWLEDIMSDKVGGDAGSHAEMCEMELIQLQNLWNIHAMTDAGAGNTMPVDCRWSHPKHGPMPFTPPP